MKALFNGKLSIVCIIIAIIIFIVLIKVGHFSNETQNIKDDFNLIGEFFNSEEVQKELEE